MALQWFAAPILLVLIAGVSGGALAFILSKRPERAELRVTNLEYVSRGADVGLLFTPVQSVSRADVCRLEYRESSGDDFAGDVAAEMAIINLAEGLRDGYEQIFHRLPSSFRCDDYAGIEDYSQEGGFHGWLRSLMPSSTSSPKPSSKITFEPLAFAEAMHAPMGRPERLGVLIVATGR